MQFHPGFRLTISSVNGIGDLMHPHDLDTWHSERALERAAAPARHAIGAWVMAALLVAVGVFGRPATHEAALGIGELRHEAGLLDRELGHLSAQLVMRTADAASRLVVPHPAKAD
jgi:hypothetical protein